MRISKVITSLCFFAGLCILNMFLSFLIEPADGASEVMWRAYNKEANLDTIFVGASVCDAAFDPTIINEKMGVNSFNMGTPAQSMATSIRALEVAFKDHNIKTVVLGMGFFGLQESANEKAELTFEKAYTRQVGGVKGVLESLKYVFSDEVRKKENSINYFFPWIYNQTTISREGISENVSKKTNPVEEIFDANTEERKWWNLEKGYSPYTGVVDYSDAWFNNSSMYYTTTLQSTCVSEFEKLMELCKENEVDLIVVNVPHPAFDIVASYDTYAETESEVKQLCKMYGVDYYNFSLVKEDIFYSNPNYYYDYEHLNYQGSQAFSEAFGDFMLKRANGVDMEKYFYTVEEYYQIHASLVEEWMKIFGKK